MSYLLTNQNNFAHISYPSSSHPEATVKSGGCGPCSALMIVENLTSNRFLMADWVSWVIAVGARVSGGTAMGTLALAMAAKFGFTYTTTDDEERLKAHLAAGGMAIANVAGANGDWRGLFSTNGHFITVLGLDGNGRLIVGDPDFRSGKFNSGTLGQWRSQYVTVSGQIVYVKPGFLHEDTKNRTPNYYLFAMKNAGMTENKENEEEEEMARYEDMQTVPAWGAATVEKLMTKGFLKGVDGSKLDLSDDMLRLLVVNDRAGLYD